MLIDFDPEKNACNIRERGIDLEQARDSDGSNALVWHNRRQDYAEERLIALGLIGERLHSLVFTVRAVLLEYGISVP